MVEIDAAAVRLVRAEVEADVAKDERVSREVAALPVLVVEAAGAREARAELLEVEEEEGAATESNALVRFKLGI